MDDRWSLLWDKLVETPFGLYATWEERLEEACGLPALNFHVLRTLALAPEGRLKLQDLAEAVRHSQSGTTRLVDRLVKDGLVERHSCESDRRVTWALLSEKGAQAYAQARPAWNQFLADHLQKGLTEAEAEVLRLLLEKLNLTLAPGVNSCPGKGGL